MGVQPDEPRVGQVLHGRYADFRVVEVIPSRGKNALLYKVRKVDDSSQHYTAKFFQRKETSPYSTQLSNRDQRAFKRFKKEARFLELFSHPNVVAYEDQFCDMEAESAGPDDCFIAMEYVHGSSLESSIESGVRLDPQTVLGFAKSLTAAVVHVHQQKVSGPSTRPDQPSHIARRTLAAARLPGRGGL